MSKGILIPEHHVKQIRDFYRIRLEEITKEVEEINGLMKMLENGSEAGNVPAEKPHYTDAISINGYNDKWSTLKKICYILETRGPQTTTDIVNSIVNDFEPSRKADRSKLVGTVSSILSTNSKEGGIFTRHKNDLDAWVYDMQKKPLDFQAVPNN